MTFSILQATKYNPVILYAAQYVLSEVIIIEKKSDAIWWPHLISQSCKSPYSLCFPEDILQQELTFVL